MILLYKTDISRIHFDYEHFGLLFSPPQRDPGSQVLRKLSHDDNDYLYGKVLENFRGHSQWKSYRMLDIKRRALVWRTGRLWWWAWAAHYWRNYGCNREWILYWTLGFVILYTLINLFFLNYLNQEVYNVENIPEILPGQIGWRLWYSLVYSSIIFFRLTLTIEKIKFQRPFVHDLHTYHLYFGNTLSCIFSQTCFTGRNITRFPGERFVALNFMPLLVFRTRVVGN